MESTAAPATPLRYLGWITQILGALALLRLIPELTFMNPTWGRDYWCVIGADLALGLFAFTAGWALRGGKKWSWGATCLFWGAASTMSVSLLVWVLPIVVTAWRYGLPSADCVALDSRFLIYAMTLAAAPYVLRTMLVLPESQRPSRPRLVSWTLAGAVSAVVFFFGLIHRP